MIIFDKFGGGQVERNRTVPVFRDNPMRIVTLVSDVRDPRSATRVPRNETAIRSSVSDADGACTIERESRSLIPAGCLSFVPSFISASTGSAETSNRELDLLERGLSHCKQRQEIVSNRELSTVHILAVSSALGHNQIGVSLPQATDHGPRFAASSAISNRFCLTHRPSAKKNVVRGMPPNRVKSHRT